jgi:hypothetical protein
LTVNCQPGKRNRSIIPAREAVQHLLGPLAATYWRELEHYSCVVYPTRSGNTVEVAGSIKYQLAEGKGSIGTAGERIDHPFLPRPGSRARNFEDRPARAELNIAAAIERCTVKIALHVRYDATERESPVSNIIGESMEHALAPQTRTKMEFEHCSAAVGWKAA